MRTINNTALPEDWRPKPETRENRAFEEWWFNLSGFDIAHRTNAPAVVKEAARAAFVAGLEAGRAGR